MALRQRNWARRVIQQLRAHFGNKCNECGATEGQLDLDCIRPCGDWHHRIEWSWRVSFYRAQFREGNLQLLCAECNGRKKNTIPAETTEKEPF